VRPRRGDRGREVRDELTGGDGRVERRRAGARERTSADRSGPQDRERGREARSGWRRQAGPACQAEGARGRGRARGGWAKWAALGRITFSFFLEFLIAFLFIFSRVLNSNSNQVSNSNQIKYVHHFKEYLGSI
jgi:hypothetical protein